MTEQELRAYIKAIRPADEAAMDAARRRQAQLAKPPGSLGQLEDMSIRLAGVTGQVCSTMGKCRVAVFAADNGVVAEGVSCTPPSVTLQQAVNMTFRKTGMSAMAAVFGDDVTVVDVGIDGDVPPVGILHRQHHALRHVRQQLPPEQHRLLHKPLRKVHQRDEAAVYHKARHAQRLRRFTGLAEAVQRRRAHQRVDGAGGQLGKRRVEP